MLCDQIDSEVNEREKKVVSVKCDENNKQNRIAYLKQPFFIHDPRSVKFHNE